jgi:hypothetical protein
MVQFTQHHYRLGNSLRRFGQAVKRRYPGQPHCRLAILSVPNQNLFSSDGSLCSPHGVFIFILWGLHFHLVGHHFHFRRSRRRLRIVSDLPQPAHTMFESSGPGDVRQPQLQQW